VKRLHEVRDAVHVFARYDPDERRVIDSRPVQRLRRIHQLALSYLVYPGATHTRFEHSLGVMELAGRVFDVITDPDHVLPEAARVLPELTRREDLPWWRRAVRLAALCHDIGHLPFSHAAEHDLLPSGRTHETMTREILVSPLLGPLLGSFQPPIPADLVSKLAIGQKHATDVSWSPWETLLSEVIVDDAFGVDRMDYLLRDSLHTGVGYGRFDHYRLIDTLRIVVPSDPETGEIGVPELGVEFGGLHSATSLLLARFFMFSQVYFHPVRVVYDLHLIDFLRSWLTGGRFPGDIEEYLRLTDDEVLSAIFSVRDQASELGDLARRLSDRGHFRVLYQQHPADQKVTIDAAQAVFRAARDAFGEGSVKYWGMNNEAGAIVFPVLMRDGRVVSSIEASEELRRVPAVRQEYVFVDPRRRSDAERWLETSKGSILEEAKQAAIDGIERGVEGGVGS
jgi:HD superfamily phosphohydrolase